MEELHLQVTFCNQVEIPNILLILKSLSDWLQPSRLRIKFQAKSKSGFVLFYCFHVYIIIILMTSSLEKSNIKLGFTIINRIFILTKQNLVIRKN